MRPPSLDDSKWIAGHRGAAGEACENTLETFAHAVAVGVDMIELDVQMTVDRVLVCFHDWTFDRLAGRPEVLESESSELVAGVEIGNQHRVPTLAEALEAIPQDMPVNVEVKRRVAERRPLAQTVLRSLAARDGIVISSFDWHLLRAFRQLDLSAPLAPIGRYQIESLIDCGRKLDAYSLHCHYELATQSFVSEARRAGFERLLTYTVNDVVEARRLFALGMSGIFTDVPGFMTRRLREKAMTS